MEYKIYTKKMQRKMVNKFTVSSYTQIKQQPNSLGCQVAKEKAKGIQLSVWGTGEEFESRKWNIKDRYRTTAEEPLDVRAKDIWASSS